MADETKVDSGPPPWQETWNPIATKALEAVNSVVEPIKQAVKGILPWEGDYSAKRPVEASSPIPEQPKQSFSYGQVFNNMIQAESGGVHEKDGQLTTSPKGAQGITQLMPATAKDPGYGIKPVQDKSQGEYLRVGQGLFNAYTKELGGDVRAGVAAYNAGIGKVKQLMAKYGDGWEAKLPAETKKYIDKVLGPTSSIKAEVQGGATLEDVRRQQFEARPAIESKFIFDNKLDTASGRKAYEDKIRSEWEAGKKGLTRAQLDKYPSNPSFYGEMKYPEMQLAYNLMTNASRGLSGDMPAELKSFLSKRNTKISEGSGNSASGFVFSDNGDRVFLSGTGDWNTLAHEAQHMDQHADMNKKGTSSSTYQSGIVGNYNSPFNQMQRFALENRKDPAVKEIFRADNAFDDGHEYMANLAGYWRTSVKQGQSLSDTAFFKKLADKFGKEKAYEMMTQSLMYVIQSPTMEKK